MTSLRADVPPGGFRRDETRLLAWPLAGFFLFAGVAGSANLFVHTVVPQGTPKLVYAVTLGVLTVAGLALVLRPALGARYAVGWILLCDLAYAGVAYAVVDPERYANPILLLFATLLAAWYLGRRGLALQLVIIVPVVWLALADSYPEPRIHLAQTVMRAGSLAAGALLVRLLRRQTEALLEETRVMSTTDVLTGLPNRRHLQDQMPGLCARAHREGLLLAALVLDIDHFKQVNDRYGHASGDRVLKAIADGVRSCLRGQDVVARTGGEEIVVLTLVEHAGDAATLAERLRSQVAGTRVEVADGAPPVATTASVGVATATVQDVDRPVDRTWRLIEVADGAMYEAKRQGRDRCVVAQVGPAGSGGPGPH